MDQQKLKLFVEKLLAVDAKSLNEQQLAEHMTMIAQAKSLMAEAPKAAVNFSVEDLKRLEQIKDLPTMKAQALQLISKPSAKPMKPEKVEWFKNALETMNSPLKVIKLMYDLLLSGEGNSVIGSRNSMNPNSYRQRFGEDAVNEISLGDYRTKANKQRALAGMGAMFGGDPDKRAKDLETARRRGAGLERVKARDEAARKAEQQRQLADLVARLPELKAEYAEMQKQYKALGGSNWQYADREQNLTDAERKARSMEGQMNNLWRQIQAAEKAQGMAEGAFDNYSPMAKDSIKADKIRSLKNLIAITGDKIEAIVNDGGRVGLNDPLSVRLNELRAELKKLQEVAESMTEGANVGTSIKSLFQKIYDQGDDEIEYFYYESPIFAMYWDKYEGDIDSIIAEVDPKELQIIHDELESYVQQANLDEGYLDNPGQEPSPVASAITRRIMLQRTDLLAKYGPEKVGQAIDSVADFVGDVDEIGSSDVSAWVKQVEQELGITSEAQERLTRVFDFKDYKG